MLQYIEWQRNQDSLLGEHVLQRQANDSVRRRQDIAAGVGNEEVERLAEGLSMRGRSALLVPVELH